MDDLFFFLLDFIHNSRKDTSYLESHPFSTSGNVVLEDFPYHCSNKDPLENKGNSSFVRDNNTSVQDINTIKVTSKPFS